MKLTDKEKGKLRTSAYLLFVAASDLLDRVEGAPQEAAATKALDAIGRSIETFIAAIEATPKKQAKRVRS